ncbi:hypothetical protein BESB_061190 [Besnoitia besnoiti]|uniref:Uncharacterized protein n=1 Tax=Besnoitia besnoiti TaxID=94643 RepID=A0A2A9MIL7_BESBE|nr:hypothetical protein BESB_061190 [Besnoitia besnoiti]PFH35232.1 hypothetical protein BESB_061190 [Besnoitia besnoiti]
MLRLQRYKDEIAETLLSQAGVLADVGLEDKSVMDLRGLSSHEFAHRLAHERRERAAVQIALKDSQHGHAFCERLLHQARKQITVLRELLRHVSNGHAIVVDGELVEPPPEPPLAAPITLTAETHISEGNRSFEPLKRPDGAPADLSDAVSFALLRSEVAALRKESHQRDMEDEQHEAALSHARVEATLLRQRNTALTEELRACLAQLDEAKSSLEECATLRNKLQDVELWAGRMQETHQAELKNLRGAQELRLQQLAMQYTAEKNEQLREAHDANQQVKEECCGLQKEVAKLKLRLQRIREMTRRHHVLQAHFHETLDSWAKCLGGTEGPDDTPYSNGQLRRAGASALGDPPSEEGGGHPADRPRVACAPVVQAARGRGRKQGPATNQNENSGRLVAADCARSEVRKPGYVRLDAVRPVLETLLQVCVHLGVAEQQLIERDPGEPYGASLFPSAPISSLDPMSGFTPRAPSLAVLQGQRLVILHLYSLLGASCTAARGSAPPAASSSLDASISYASLSQTCRVRNAAELSALLGLSGQAGTCSRCAAADLARRALCKLPLDKRTLHTELDRGAQRLQSLLQRTLQELATARCAQAMLEERVSELPPSRHPALFESSRPLSCESALRRTHDELSLRGIPPDPADSVAVFCGTQTPLSPLRAGPLLSLVQCTAAEAAAALEKADAVAESLAVKLGAIFSISGLAPETRGVRPGGRLAASAHVPSHAALRLHGRSDQRPSLRWPAASPAGPADPLGATPAAKRPGRSLQRNPAVGSLRRARGCVNGPPQVESFLTQLRTACGPRVGRQQRVAQRCGRRSESGSREARRPASPSTAADALLARGHSDDIRTARSTAAATEDSAEFSPCESCSELAPWRQGHYPARDRISPGVPKVPCLGRECHQHQNSGACLSPTTPVRPLSSRRPAQRRSLSTPARVFPCKSECSCRVCGDSDVEARRDLRASSSRYRKAASRFWSPRLQSLGASCGCVDGSASGCKHASSSLQTRVAVRSPPSLLHAPDGDWRFRRSRPSSSGRLSPLSFCRDLARPPSSRLVAHFVPNRPKWLPAPLLSPSSLSSGSPARLWPWRRSAGAHSPLLSLPQPRINTGALGSGSLARLGGRGGERNPHAACSGCADASPAEPSPTPPQREESRPAAERRWRLTRPGASDKTCGGGGGRGRGRERVAGVPLTCNSSS